MKPSEKLDKEKACARAKVHALSHDGRGIAAIDNKTTFIQGALPDEEVLCKIKQKRSSYNDADLLEVLIPSPERVTPPCRHFGLCGGCSLQHMSANTQMALKQQTLLDQLKHFGQVIPQHILKPLHADTVGYRRKARLGVKYVIKKNKLLVGFREKSSHYLAELEGCEVLHPCIGKRFQAVSELVMSLEQFQQIPQIEIAVGDETAAFVFRHLKPLSESDQAKLIAFGEKHQIHIYLQPNAPETVHKIWPKDQHERLTYTLPDENLAFLFHPLDFTQINLPMNRLMVQQALQLLELKSTDHVLDLFCGIGNFTLPIARHAEKVTGIEGSTEMVLRATANATHNLIKNTEFYAENLFEPTPSAAWMKKRYHKVLLDPPRAGAKEILPFIKQFDAQKIVYVSCNPATLARDAGELVHQHGYQLTHAGIMNMFPHTAHIEAMAVFEK